MRWHKLGLVFCPTGQQPWAREYAHLPTPVLIDDDIIRVFYAGLDAERRGSVGFIDVRAADPTSIVAVAREPVLGPGDKGAFDHWGVNPTSVLHEQDEWRLFYIGWDRSGGCPYRLLTGCAISRDGRTFVKAGTKPLLPEQEGAQDIRSAACVRRRPADYQCWYVAGERWTTVNGQQYPEYDIRTIISADGWNWTDGSRPCIVRAGDEFGIGRPWVMIDPDMYRMWYSIRSRTKPYRIGYAESVDGLSWVRRDADVGITASAGGWDSEMICYPAIIDACGRRYMFYNGNRHGRTGFGVAVLEQD